MQNAFIGQAETPTEEDLSAALGNSYPLWKDLVADLKRELALDKEEWNTYSSKAGWSLRLQRKKRNIVYLSPAEGSFLASFILGDKAIAAAAKLPTPMRDLIAAGKRYPEGTAIRIEVHNAKDLAMVKVLAKLKLEN
jgi:Protein of unknown function (DUF3788)